MSRAAILPNECVVPEGLRQEHVVMTNWVKPKARVLDLGCADGALLAHLQAEKQVLGYGLDIDLEEIQKAISRGVSVIQADLESGLQGFDDDSFDTVILSQTLPTVEHTERLIDDMLRVGREAFISFPNFGYWQVRSYLYFRGQMPVSKRLPYEWYNTPNIHLFTIRDFYRLCRDKGMTIEDHYFQTGKRSPITTWQPNFFAELAAFRVTW